jgi:hypothetical protein
MPATAPSHTPSARCVQSICHTPLSSIASAARQPLPLEHPEPMARASHNLTVLHLWSLQEGAGYTGNVTRRSFQTQTVGRRRGHREQRRRERGRGK